MYQNIADTEVTASQAAGTIIAMTKAFSNEGLTAIQTIDKINEVANKFAVSSADIATALPKVASTMSLAGNTASETIGLLTAGTELMPNQASRVARGLRSITLNLQGLTKEGEKSTTLTAKMEKSFNDIDMTLTDASTGGLKSTYDILKELSIKWKDLTPDQQKYYAALIGGKQQVDVVTSVIKNFSSAIGANQAAIDSAGSAARENEKYLEGIEGRIALFRTEFQKLSAQLINSKLIKNTVSFATGFLKILTASDALIPKMVLLATAVWGVSKAFTFMQLTALPSVMKGFSNFATQLGNVINGTKQVNQYMGDTMTTVTKTGSRMSALGKLLPINPYLLFAAAIAAVAYALYKDYKAYDDTLAEITKNADKLEKIQSKISKLEEKKARGETLSQDEQDYYNILLIEEDVLKRQNKLLDEKLQKIFRQKNTVTITDPKTGKSGDGFASDKIEQNMKASSDSIDIYKQKNRDLTKEYDGASKKRKDQIKEEIDANKKLISSEQTKIDKNKIGLTELAEKYDTTFGAEQKGMTESEKLNDKRISQLNAGSAIIAQNGKTDVKSILALGDAFGIVTDASGKSEVNIAQLTSQFSDLGMSDSQIEKVIATLQGVENVNLTDTASEVTTISDEIDAISGKSDINIGVSKDSFERLTRLKTLLTDIWNKSGISPFIANVAKNVVKTVQHAKGTKNARNEIAEVNEEGFELIRDKDGVRIAGGGERTVTKLNQGDEVIPHNKSVEMLSGKKDTKLDGFAGGTPISTALPKGRYTKTTSTAFGTSSDDLKHRLEMNEISEQNYYENLMALRNQYYKAGRISLDDSRRIEEEVHSYNEKLKEDSFDAEVKRLEALEKQYSAHQELLNKYAEKQVDNIDKTIEGYEKEKEQLEKQNEASGKSNALMEAQNKLVEAKSRKVKLYRAGVGFGYESDVSAVSEAQKELDLLKAQYALEDKILAIDEKIALAEQEKAKWSAVTSTWQDEQDILNLEQIAGTTLSAISSSINGSLSTFDSVYSNIGANLEGIIDAISQTEGSNGIQSAGTIANLINGNRHATGTSSARGGLSLVGEQGAELRVLGKGDGIMPNNITKNLMDIGRFNAKELINASNSIGATASNNQTSFNFGAGSIVVNGNNAESLAKDIINNMNRIVQQNEKQRS